jgi:hypothetical protein
LRNYFPTFHVTTRGTHKQLSEFITTEIRAQFLLPLNTVPANLFFPAGKDPTGRIDMSKVASEKYNEGLQKILKNGKEAFRIPENLLYYSEEDFKDAEKKYLKLCVIGGKC